MNPFAGITLIKFDSIVSGDPVSPLHLQFHGHDSGVRNGWMEWYDQIKHRITQMSITYLGHEVFTCDSFSCNVGKISWQRTFNCY